MKKFLLVLLASLGFGVSDLFADSDGYFCSGPGYIAYHFRAWNWHTMQRHVVRIVKFSNGKVMWAGDVVVKDFQPHLMKCAGNRVTIGGFDRGWIEYDINVIGTPSVLAERTDPNRQFKAGEHGPIPNLGDWSKADMIRLTRAANDGFDYQLELKVQEDPKNRLCRDRTAALVAKSIQTQQLSQHFWLFKGRTCETAD